jgi:hypothetical protein
MTDAWARRIESMHYTNVGAASAHPVAAAEQAEGCSMHTLDIDVGNARAMSAMPVKIRAANVAACAAADWLSLAAAPTFAVMALLTAAFGGTPDVLCAALQGTSPLSGMVPMYLLMSAFHLAPWLKLIARRRVA